MGIKQSLPVMSVGVLKVPAHAVNYQAYYTWVDQDEKLMLLLNGNNMGLVYVIAINYHKRLNTRLLMYYTPSTLYLTVN